MKLLKPLLVAALAFEIVPAPPAGAALAQSPSPRACAAARARGRMLAGCTRSRPRPEPTPARQRTRPRATAEPAPILVPGPEPAPSSRADPSALVGTWQGVVLEPRSLTQPQYPLSVRIEADSSGQPVGAVQYPSFPCTGVWSSPTLHGTVWRFKETIIEGGARGSEMTASDGTPLCAADVVIELEVTGDREFLNVRLYPNNYESQPSRGTLRRSY